MKITHVITTISRKYGGTSTYLRDLLNALPQEASNTLVCYESDDALSINQNIKIKNIHLKKRGLSVFSKDFKKLFITIDTEVFHANGLWDFPMHIMAKYARELKLPYIISPHGMLEPWSLTQSTFKKKLALKLYQHKDLKLASCIHTTAQSEADNIRALGFKNPIAIIPNGINLKEFPNYEKKELLKRKVLFLSRIHSKKGVELLINAWNELNNEITSGWEVEIVGNGEEAYINSLKKMINSLNLGCSIIISEPVFGEMKIKKYQSASLFVLPTYSENFGIVIAEALASKVPVITTYGAPWEDLNTYKCGQWVEIGKEPLMQSLEIMLLKSKEELNEMGDNGRMLIENQYGMEAVANKMIKLYEWLLTNKTKPEFIKIIKTD